MRTFNFKSIFVAIFSLFAISANAEIYTGSCGDNAYWSFDSETGILEITGTGDMDDFSYGDTPWYEYRYDIKSIEFGYNINSIGDYAFYNCTSLTSVSTMPIILLRIGEKAFYNCTSLTSIIIPGTVTEIGDLAFSKCTSLTKIIYNLDNAYYHTIHGVLFNGDENTIIQYPAGKSGAYSIPESVTQIGNSAFAYCSNLTSISIPESVTQIEENAFSDCTGLTSISIPNNVTKIEDNTFSNCTGLTSIFIPNGVTQIGNSAFEYCPNLTSISIPESVTQIGQRAFAYCLSLTSISIPESVTQIEELAFENCSDLTEINVDEDNQSYASIYGVLFNKDKSTIIQYPAGKSGAYSIPNSVTQIGNRAFAYCSNLTSISIPNSITQIGDNAFSDCPGLTSISIPNSITQIGNSTFEYCYNLASVSIPNSVTQIGDNAFLHCEKLTSVTIPESVNQIGDYAFRDCYRLTSIYSLNPTPPTLSENTFFDVPKIIPVYIPKDSKRLYESADRWNDFKNFIEVGSCGDDTYWSFDSETEILEIRGTGEMSNFSYGDTPWYEYRHDIKSIEIDYGITSIGDYAFAYCSSLTSVSIPNSVTKIGNNAFENCVSLTSVSIPNSVTEIREYAFAYCGRLTEINVDEDNQLYASIDGILFNKDKSVIIQYPNGKSGAYSIPESVTQIRYSSFENCVNLTSVTIPNSVAEIGDYAFSGCERLTSIYSLRPTPPTLLLSVFNGVPNSIPVYIPKDSKSLYESDYGWNEFTNFIESDFTGVEDSNISAIEIKAIAGNGIDICSYYGKLQVINLSGVVVKETFVNGSAQIALPKGAYIIVTDNKSQKVVL